MIDWKNLDGALLVRSFSSVEGDESIYAWFGAERVHIYNVDLIEVDVFSLDLNLIRSLSNILILSIKAIVVVCALSNFSIICVVTKV